MEENNISEKNNKDVKENVGSIKSVLIIIELIIILILVILMIVKVNCKKCEECKPCTLENYELFKNYDNLRLSLIDKEIKIIEKENILSNEKNTLFFNHENRSMKINIEENNLILYSQNEIILTTNVSTDSDELNYELYIDNNVIMIINKKNDNEGKVDFLLYNKETRNYGHMTYNYSSLARPIFTENGIYFGYVNDGVRSNAINGKVINVYLLDTINNNITYQYNLDYNEIEQAS